MTRDLRVALVAMPWTTADQPSPAVGALAAWVKREEPGYHVKTFHPFIDVVRELGWCYELVASDLMLGELIYATCLYPEGKANVAATLLHFIRARGIQDSEHLSLEQWVELTFKVAATSVQRVAESLRGRFDVVGLTTSYCQLFANVAVAQALKALDPDVKIVFGGPTVAGEVGASVLREYPSVDAVIQGEGEVPFLRLLRSWAAGRPPEVAAGLVLRSGEGILAADDGRTLVSLRTIKSQEVSNLDDLPYPDYDEFFADTAADGAPRTLPVEAARGCWWARMYKTGDPTDSCLFCGFNAGTWRTKSVPRVVTEITALVERYQMLNIRFLDNITRTRGQIELAEGLRDTGLGLTLFNEMRASIKPKEILALWEAGLDVGQVGVEGLSTAYLKRMNKGTRAIDNLQSMKVFLELEISNRGNLIAAFPGSTPEEVEETRSNILNYAIAYQPLSLVNFSLERLSAVYRLPEQFGIRVLGNDKQLLQALPRDVWERLKLWWMEFESDGPVADWSPVAQAVMDWVTLHYRLGTSRANLAPVKPLKYSDGKSFLEIVDLRARRMVIRLTGVERELYLFCGEIRSFKEIVNRFGRTTDAEKLSALLESLHQRKLVFTEDGDWLSLAAASRPEAAVRRIRGLVVA